MFHTLPIRTAGKSSDQEKPSANDCNCEGGIKTSTPGIRKRTVVHQHFDEDLRRLERLATLHQRLQVETYGGLEEGVSKQADALIKPLNHLLQIGAISESSAILYLGRLADVRETILRQRFPVGIFWMNDDFSTCVDSIMATLMCAMNGDLVGCKIAWDFDPLTALEKLEELDRKIATQNIFGGILGATVSHRLQYLIGQQIDRELDQGDNLICAGNPTSATVGESVPFGTGAVKSFPGAPISCKEHNLVRYSTRATVFDEPRLLIER